MTALMCSLFYIYCIFAINYYRKEILLRIEAEDKVKFKVKAPLKLKKAVLFAVFPIPLNVFFQIIATNEILIFLNIIPVLILLFILKRYEKRIIKMDRKR